MGQARRNKMNGKTNTVKNHTERKLEVIGAFYKDDTPEGFNFVVSRSSFQDAFEPMVDSIKFMVNSANKEITEGRETKEGMAKYLMGQTIEMIPELRNRLWGSPIRPDGVVYRTAQLDFSDKDLVFNIAVFMSNIIWLTENGYLPNDKYNGTQYVHMTEGK